MKPCCDDLADYVCKEQSPIRIDAYGVAFLVSRMEGYAVEQTISYCPFCGMDISLKNTHRLEGVLSIDSEFQICLADGIEMEVKDCVPVDFSIYRQTGGWSGSVVTLTGSEKQMRLFKPGSGIDFYEDDILTIRNSRTGDIVYEKQKC